MNKPARRSLGLNKKMRRTVDVLMGFVCLAIVVKGCSQSGEETIQVNGNVTERSLNYAVEQRPTENQVTATSPAPRVGAILNVSEASATPRKFQISKSQMEDGKRAYVKSCVACHQATGEGIAGLFPPLAKADYLMADKERSIRIILQGQTGEIVVNGTRYNGAMPPIPLKDEQIASVLTYVRNSWGNSGEPVTVEDVRKVKEEVAGKRALADAR